MPIHEVKPILLTLLDCLSEYILKLFWARGVEPTPEALSKDGNSNPVT